MSSSSEVRRHFRRDASEIVAAVTLMVPALRDRLDRLPALTDAFVAQAVTARGRSALTPSAQARQWLEKRIWAGNVRELKNVVDRAVAAADGDGELEFEELARGSEVRAASRAAGPADLRGAVAEVLMQRTEVPAGTLGGERDRIVAALSACAFNQSRAAARLGISRRTLVARLDQFGIDRPLKHGWSGSTEVTDRIMRWANCSGALACALSAIGPVRALYAQNHLPGNPNRLLYKCKGRRGD